MPSRDHQNVVIRTTQRTGKGVFANGPIKKGEVVTSFEGDLFWAKKLSDVPNSSPRKVLDCAIQVARNWWQESNGAGHWMNHSCDPNCGLLGTNLIVAMRDIRKGEHLAFDYAMTENSDGWMRCRCGAPNCRKMIHGYRYLPKEIKRKYGKFVSAWIRNSQKK